MKILDYLKPVKQEINLDIMPDAMFTLECDGKIVDVNDKVLKMYNITKFDILGKYSSER